MFKVVTALIVFASLELNAQIKLQKENSNFINAILKKDKFPQKKIHLIEGKDHAKTLLKNLEKKPNGMSEMDELQYIFWSDFAQSLEVAEKVLSDKSKCLETYKKITLLFAPQKEWKSSEEIKAHYDEYFPSGAQQALEIIFSVCE
jgi:hypothetical protein